MSKTKSQLLLLWLTVIAGITIIALSLFHTVVGDKPYAATWIPIRTKDEIKAACQQHVAAADQRANAAVAKRAEEFASFIASRKTGASPFATEVVSLYGKWRVVKSFLPFTPKDDHRHYVDGLFTRHIFSIAEIAAAMRLAIEGSIKDLEGIENELAVALRQEMLGRSLKPDEIPIAAEHFRKAIDQMVKASQFDAAKTVGNLIVSEVAAQAATQVVLRLGISSGILATGAASSWWSLGGGLLAGIIADMVWGWFDNPRGDIERELHKALDQLSQKAAHSIQNEMSKIISERRNMWSQALDAPAP